MCSACSPQCVHIVNHGVCIRVCACARFARQQVIYVYASAYELCLLMFLQLYSVRVGLVCVICASVCVRISPISLSVCVCVYALGTYVYVFAAATMASSPAPDALIVFSAAAEMHQLICRE